MLQMTMITLGRAAPIFASVTAILIYAATNDEFSPGTIFATISIFQSLRWPMLTAPMAITA